MAARSPATLYAGTDFGVYRSIDGGRPWPSLDQDMPLTAVPYYSTGFLAVASDGTVYAVTDVWSSPTTSRANLLRQRPGETAWPSVGGDATSRYLTLATTPGPIYARAAPNCPW